MRASDIYWLCWIVTTLTAFFLKEIPSLVKHNGGTLSESVWRLEEFIKGQPINQWSAGHILFLVFWLAVGGIWFWLFGHFILGWWR